MSFSRELKALNKRRRKASIVTAIVAALLLSACQNKSASLSADPVTTASTSASGPSFKQTEALAKKWEQDNSNLAVGLAYSDSLGALDQRPTQLQVLKTLSDRNPNDAAVQTKVGKKLLAIGEGAGAIEMLERATAMNPSDWQALSALGTAYDQQTQHVQAREKYEAALAVKPGELSIMNNLAMSFALQGKLPEAERILREASTNPASKAQPRIRQNLALVVGLQGRFEESQKIASTDLPPDQVQANLAYLQQMLSRKNTWAQLSDGQG